MDPTFYEDNTPEVVQHRTLASIHDLKASLTLNVKPTSSPSSTASNAITLRLASPEFEEIIVRQDMKAALTPMAILFPKLVTREQEEYARGFLQALEKLHRSNGQPCIISSENSSTSKLCSETTRQDVSPAAPKVAAASVANASLSNSEDLLVNQALGAINAPRQNLLRLSEMPQIVPSSIYAASPGASGKTRLEIKRARNRLAAQRCRIRKIERIAELSERVRELKTQNVHLARTSCDLKNQAEGIKRQLVQHVALGCRIGMPGLTM